MKLHIGCSIIFHTFLVAQQLPQSCAFISTSSADRQQHRATAGLSLDHEIKYASQPGSLNFMLHATANNDPAEDETKDPALSSFHDEISSLSSSLPSVPSQYSKNWNRRNFIQNTAMLTSSICSSTSVMPPKIANAQISTAAAQTASELILPPIGLGAWAWGDSIFWGYNPKQDNDLKEVFDYALSKNLAFFDTAELYGLGRSETLLGNFRQEAGQDGAERVQIATKFAALPFRTKAKDVVKACKDSLKRLNPDSKSNYAIDLYQIHFPNAWSNEEYWDGLAQCYEEGLVKAVGVSNYGVDALRAVHDKLAQRGIPLATNQIQMSLLYRFPIENGLLQACKDLNVKVLSYSPLAVGFLTGKYDENNRPSGPRQSIAKKLFDGPDEGKAIRELLDVMRSIAANHGGVPVSQVSLNWTRAKGTIPIPGARSLKQAKQNLGALEWDLTEDEIQALDIASARVPTFISPEQSPFPKQDINTKLKMFDS